MPPSIAALCYAILIAGLFWLDRNRSARTSAALWIPVLWFWIACSRSVTQWLQMETRRVGRPGQEGSPIDRLALACLLAAGLVVLIGRRKRVAQILQANWPLIIVFLLTAWSACCGRTIRTWPSSVGHKPLAIPIMVLIILSERNRSLPSNGSWPD